MRRLYLFLLRLHPRTFRLRFEEDLALTLDDMSKRKKGYRILWDVATSLARQWILRPHHWLKEPVSPARNEEMFRFVVERRPHPMSLLLGCVVSVALFFGIAASATGLHIAGLPNGFASSLAKSFEGLWPRTDFFPNQSPAEKRLAEWVEAYNTGQRSVMESFFATGMDDHSLKLESSVELLQEWSRTYETFGPYRLRQTEQSGPGPHHALAMAQVNDGTWWEILVDVSTEKPNRIVKVTLNRLNPSATEKNARKR
jgi:hypothetical protein